MREVTDEEVAAATAKLANSRPANTYVFRGVWEKMRDALIAAGHALEQDVLLAEHAIEHFILNGHRVVPSDTDPATPDPVEPPAPAAPPALRTDGPTLAEYVAAGYTAEMYPPAGYAAKDPEPPTEVTPAA